MKLEKSNGQFIGIASAASAYILWGILPIYWKLVYLVPSLDVLAHRVVWSFIFLVVVLLITGKLRAFFGFLQYIAPTIALVLGVFLYHEPFTTVHLVSFIFIWAALSIFSLSRAKSFIQLESAFLKKIALKRETA